MRLVVNRFHTLIAFCVIATGLPGCAVVKEQGRMEAKALGDPTPWIFSAGSSVHAPRFYRPEDMSEIRLEHHFGFDYEQYRFEPKFPLPFDICSDLSELKLNSSQIVLELDGRRYVPSRSSEPKTRDAGDRVITCWPMEFPVHFRDRETPFTVTLGGLSLRGEPLKLPPVRLAYNGNPFNACILLQCLQSH
jgi:hypothetical protein